MDEEAMTGSAAAAPAPSAVPAAAAPAAAAPAAASSRGAQLRNILCLGKGPEPKQKPPPADGAGGDDASEESGPTDVPLQGERERRRRRMLLLGGAGLLALLALGLGLGLGLGLSGSSSSDGGAAAPTTAPQGSEDDLLTSAPASTTLYSLDIPGRYQYDDENGYCGEVSIQTLMLKHGAWIPQEVARAQGGGELLPGINYDAALDALSVDYIAWSGNGTSSSRRGSTWSGRRGGSSGGSGSSTNYQSFLAWAKQQLKAGLPVISVAFVANGRDDQYDHIEPIVGVATPDATSTAFNRDDVFYVLSNYGTTPLLRRAAGFWCTAANKTWNIKLGGCVPDTTRWGYAIKGPSYAGIGPAVSLAVDSSREPGLGTSAAMAGTLTISGLTAGKSYRLYKVTELDSVPPQADPSALAGLAPLQTFVAKGANQTQRVTFESGTPAYFIAVAAA